MIRAFWFLVKTGVLVALAVLAASQPGLVEFTWHDYTVKAQLGFALLVFLVALGVVITLVRFLDGVLYWPQFWALSRRQQRQDKGLRALTRGLAAVAAGDSQRAALETRRAGKFLDAKIPLRLLLQAQTAQLQGDEMAARGFFEKLSHDADGKFLGLRGQIQIALGQDDLAQAQTLARQALLQARRGQWALQAAYDLAMRTQQWPEALALLPRLHDKNTPQFISARRALLIAQADVLQAQGFQGQALSCLKGALRVDPGFVPTALRLAHLHRLMGQTASARKVVMDCWRRQTHPALAKLWHDLIPPRKAAHASARLRWIKRLVDAAPAQGEGYLALGCEALAQSLWGLARNYLLKAEQFGPDQRVYELLATVEKQSGNASATAQAWLDKARQAPPCSVWLCAQTGRIYPQWQPVALPHGAFNTMIWGLPEAAQDVRLVALT